MIVLGQFMDNLNLNLSSYPFMSTQFEQLNSLIPQIVKHLSTDQNKLRIFKNILLRFKRSPINPQQTFEQLKDILSDNPELQSQIDLICRNFPYEDNISTHFSNFILETNGISKDNPKLGFILAELISYYSEEFITIQFLHYYSSFLISELPIDIQKVIHGKIHFLAQEINVHKTLILQDSQSQSQILHLLPDTFDINPLFSIPPHIQFLTMAHFLLPSKEDLFSIIKCLKMYGNFILNDQEAIEWINHFNEFLGDFLKEILVKYDPSSFLPLNLKSMIELHIPSEELRIWSVGKTILSFLDNTYTAEITTANFAQKHEENVEFHSSCNLFLPQSFLSLRHEAFYDAINKSIKNIQNHQEMTYSHTIIEAIYGKHHSVHMARPHKPFQDKDGIFYKRCKQLGGDFLDKEIKLRTNAMEQFDVTNNEWRIHYFSLLEPHFIEKMLVFQGTKFQFRKEDGEIIMNRKILEILNPILCEFTSKFEKLDKNLMEKFLKGLEEGIHYCRNSAALCLYYYFIMCHSIQTSLSLNKISLDSDKQKDSKFLSNLKGITSLVMQSSFPFEPFGNTPLAHFDLPLLHFVKLAAKIRTPFIFSDDISDVLNDSKELHFFEINSTPESITIIASANPTSQNVGILRRRRQDDEIDTDATDDEDELEQEEEESHEESIEENIPNEEKQNDYSE